MAHTIFEIAHINRDGKTHGLILAGKAGCFFAYASNDVDPGEELRDLVQIVFRWHSGVKPGAVFGEAVSKAPLPWQVVPYPKEIHVHYALDPEHDGEDINAVTHTKALSVLGFPDMTWEHIDGGEPDAPKFHDFCGITEF